MKAEKLQKYYGYNGLSVRRAYHQTYEQTQPPRQFPLVENNTLVGIEIEAENVKCVPYPDYYWHTTDDGSLRNNGVEFVSIPLRTNQVEYAVDYLRSTLAQNNDVIFSPRTSVHVHMNVRDFTWEQVKVFVLLYAVFERHFFHIAGRSRENNVFCVPLYRTKQLQTIFNIETEPKWHKYNALNLAPIYGDTGENLKRYGTIEFRHLYGTLDTATIVNWVNSICCLRKYSVSQKLDALLEQIKSMNTTSEYVELYKKVFGSYADLSKMTKFDFESCVSFTKVALWGKDLNLKYKGVILSRYHKLRCDPPKQEEPVPVPILPKKVKQAPQMTGEDIAKYIEAIKALQAAETVWGYTGVTTNGGNH